jgi:hypothetical protein
MTVRAGFRRWVRTGGEAGGPGGVLCLSVHEGVNEHQPRLMRVSSGCSVAESSPRSLRLPPNSSSTPTERASVWHCTELRNPHIGHRCVDFDASIRSATDRSCLESRYAAPDNTHLKCQWGTAPRTNDGRSCYSVAVVGEPAHGVALPAMSSAADEIDKAAPRLELRV